MSRKTRKLIWSAPLVAVLAVAGALVIFAAQSPGAAQATHEMLPGAPQNVTIEADGHHAIKLGWDAPTSDGTPTGYRIDRSEDNGTWFTHEPMLTDTSYTDTGLEAGSTWFYRVFAYNTAGTGPVSEDRTETTDVATAPGRVRALTATATDQNSIRLTWQAPEKNGGAPIKHYEMHFAPKPDSTPTDNGLPAATVRAADDEADTVVATDGAVTTFNHGMLKAETRYRYIVYAVNEEDLKGTEDSALKAATTDDLTAPGQPTGLTAVQSGEHTVQLYWYVPANNGGTEIEGYDTDVRLGCSGDWVDVDTQWTGLSGSDAHDASWMIPTDNTRPTRACFRVRAHNSPVSVLVDAERRYGSYSRTTRPLPVHADDAARIKVVPLAVTGTRASYTNDRAKVTWDAVALDQGLTVTRVSGYRVDVSEDGIFWEPIRGGSNTNRADDEGKPFFEYNYDGGEARTYRVFAKVAQTLGPATDPFSSTEESDGVVAPGHVRSLVATAAGPTQINVRWNAPTSDGGASIDHYIVQASMKVGNVFAVWPTDFVVGTAGNFNFKTETTSYAHTGLKAGETWRYRVFAVNAETAVTPNVIVIADEQNKAEVDQATTHQESKPGMSELLSVEMASTSNNEAAGSAGLLLLWNAPQDPAGADIRGYQVQRMSNDGPWATLSDDPDTGHKITDFTDTEGLEDDDETRAYRVRAVSENGVEGEWSDAAYYPQDMTHNTSPTAVGTIAAVTVAAGQMSEMDVSGYFSDADMDTLTYTAMSDTEMYATAEVDGSMLTITGVAPGSAMITVTATDAADAYAMQTIMVTVEAANTPPMAEGMIAPVTVTAGEMSDAMDVSGYFSDADTGDTLTYTASSDMMSYATASVSGSMVTITGVAAGTATITVTATDMDDATATQEIMVTVEAASMDLTAPTGVSGSLFAGSSIIVSWDADSAQNADLIVVALFNEGVTALANIPKNTHPISLDAMDDPGTYSFDNVPSGTYKVAVASESGGVYKVSLAAEVVTVP